MAPDSPFHLGCPAWSIPEWRGGFLPAKAKREAFLSLYSRVFNTVEGNSTFYALPSLETARRWTESVPEDFAFAFKVPRDISHGRGLTTDREALAGLFRFLAVFAEAGVIGPTFLQVHESFGPDRLRELVAFSESWPSEFPLAVEVRHPAFFEQGDDEKRFDELLRQRDWDRVIFDSRALFQSGPDDAAEAASQARKPRVPVNWTATGKHPFLRLVGRNRIGKVDRWLREAAGVVAGWLREGRRPFLFMHVPDDAFAPDLCARFHRFLCEAAPDLPALDITAAQGPESQLDLF